MRTIKHFIDSGFIESSSGKTFDQVAPATGQIVGQVSEAGRDEVNQAVAAARNALNGEWGQLNVEQRCQLLYGVADGINARFDEFLAAECEDTGKPYSLARHIDIPRGAANFKIFADTVRNAASKSFEMATPDGAGAINYAVHVPKGVIAVICPWNLPLLLMTWKVGPALACGDTVIVKPSEETPATATLLGPPAPT
jgi:aminomuconate-semialdehyde/2-hydroxymuconate-6-semialdehyde dehydrogenase